MDSVTRVFSHRNKNKITNAGTRFLLLIIFISSSMFNNLTLSENDQAVSMKLALHTSSDWTRVEITGTGNLKIWESFTIPNYYNSNIIIEANYISIWIGKPQFDDTLTRVELRIVTVNPSDLTIKISKGYIGFTSLTVSCWDDEYREIALITHTNTEGDPSHNRFNARINREKLVPSEIGIAEPFIKQEKHVLAIYYPWYGAPDNQGTGRHWGNVTEYDIQHSNNYPIIGAYDSLNESIILGHIETASEYGVTGFAVSWWGIGSYEDKVFNKVLDAGGKACVYYETNRDGPEMSPERVASELNYIIQNYGYHENYIRYLEKPVILVFDADGYGRDKAFWEMVISKIRSCILVGDFRGEELLDVFDGVHIYNELDFIEHRRITSWISSQNKRLPYRSISCFNSMSREGSITYIDKLTIGTVSPGYDDTKIRPNGTRLPRMGGETYQRYWDNIHESSVDWVLITSWNEWHEGTEIEPSLEHGYEALVETNQQSKRFRESYR